MDAADFDLESLVHLEQSFYDAGHAAGAAHGRIHGLIEGRALGRAQGFAMWEELGFYEGAARAWAALGRRDERAAQHTKALLDLIGRFPRANPSPSDPADIPRLLRQIRSRYKALCAALGMRPSIRATAAETSPPLAGEKGGEGGGEGGLEVGSVWKLEPKKALGPGLDF
ncbi:hypothetical protein HWV62_11031 [Athelia sp. TMB]|nr:hypothetical protein HWV62_11031 [Athelia sp. TMB]